MSASSIGATCRFRSTTRGSDRLRLRPLRRAGPRPAAALDPDRAVIALFPTSSPRLHWLPFDQDERAARHLDRSGQGDRAPARHPDLLAARLGGAPARAAGGGEPPARPGSSRWRAVPPRDPRRDGERRGAAAEGGHALRAGGESAAARSAGRRADRQRGGPLLPPPHSAPRQGRRDPRALRAGPAGQREQGADRVGRGERPEERGRRHGPPARRNRGGGGPAAGDRDGRGPDQRPGARGCPRAR